MNDPRSPDRLLAAWFEADAPASAPDALKTDIYRATSRIRPVPPWLARMRGNPMDVILGGAGRRTSRLVPVFVLLLLTLALVAGVAFVGSRQPSSDPAVVPPTANLAAPTASASAGESATPAPSTFSDGSIELPYPVIERIVGDDAMWVSTGGERTREQAESIYRVDPSTMEATLVVDEIPVQKASNHRGFVEGGGSLWVGEDEVSRFMRFDNSTGEYLEEIPVGTRPLEPIAGLGGVWSENYEDGTVTRIDPATGDVVATIVIPQFDGNGPRDLAIGSSLLWAVDPFVSTMVGIDPATNDVAKEVALSGTTLCGVNVVGGRVYAESCDVATVPTEVIDDATGVSQGTYEGNIAIADDGTFAWTADYAETTSIKALDPRTLTYAGPVVDLGVPVNYITSGHGSIWYAQGTNLHRVALDALPSN
jgi:streptogramin lyase